MCKEISWHVGHELEVVGGDKISVNCINCSDTVVEYDAPEAADE